MLRNFANWGKDWKNWGISHRLSVPYSHQQMGRVERHHRHIIDTNIALLKHAKMPPVMWEFGVTTACCLYNRNPTPILQGCSPIAALFGKIPEYDRMRVFGCVCCPCLRPYRTHKLDQKSTSCVFVGYSIQNNGYLCLEPNSHQIFASRDVVFDELNFSLNKCFHRDSPCKDMAVIAQGFSTEKIIGDSNSAVYEDAIRSPSINSPPGEEEVSDPGLSDNPEFDSQISNDDRAAPAVLTTLANTCSDDTSQMIPDADEGEDCVESSWPVTRASKGIYKPNPKYALAVAGIQRHGPSFSEVSALDSKMEAGDGE